MKKGILVINTWNSECADCGKDCDRNEKRHITNLGYGPQNGTKGCGIKWKYVTSGYMDMEETIKKIRPDLKYVDYGEALKLTLRRGKAPLKGR